MTIRGSVDGIVLAFNVGGRRVAISSSLETHDKRRVDVFLTRGEGLVGGFISSTSRVRGHLWLHGRTQSKVALEGIVP